jgi:YjbE family integral membrane protein
LHASTRCVGADGAPDVCKGAPLTNLWPAAAALLQVIFIDVSLSGDNAIIIAMAAAGLTVSQRKRAIGIGIGGAILLRVVFAIVTVSLLDVPGLVLVGGLMLAWVCWKMWRELRASEEAAEQHVEPQTKTLWQAVLQITIADVSMSLDNVLAVAGAARDHIWVMATGLILSIVMMAVAANFIVGLLKRWPVLNYIGLALIVYVSARMIFDGAEALGHLMAAGPLVTGR